MTPNPLRRARAERWGRRLGAVAGSAEPDTPPPEPAAASFAAFHLLDRAATGSWPFEKAHALLTLDSASDAEIQLPETEAGGANRRGATSLGH